MRKYLLLMMGLMICSMGFAQEVEDPYIWSPYTIDMLQVIIRDEDNDIIYSNVCMPLVQGMTTFALPSTVCTDKYSIELIYGDHHLIGYF